MRLSPSPSVPRARRARRALSARVLTLVAGAALTLLAPPTVAAQSGEGAASGGGGAAATRVMHAIRRTGEIVIDGRLDDAAWQQAPVASDFTQSYPNPGQKPTDRTEVRVLYDNDALYVGVRMYDAHPDSIAAQLARRDASGIYSDWLHLIIDSYHDRRTAFRFSVNPRGVEKDVYTYDDGNEDVNWDAVWDVGTRIDSLGWVAEYKIPLSQLRFGAARNDTDRTWGIQVMRDVARRNERDSWSPWTPQSPGFVSVFGDLTDLRDIPAPKRLEILPYASSKITRAPGSASDPFYKATDTKPSIGADVRYGLPAGLTLTATVNPDFGQVEVDPAVVNLSAYETFFPEKRPFFLEGSDIFNFGQVRRQNDYGQQYFFYSRRIGRAPEVSPYGAGVVAADVPDQSTIAGAAKITGKAGPWSVGMLDAVTTQADARIAMSSGARATTPVEPLTNYFAGRVKHEFNQGASFIGGMLTSTVRSMSDSVFSPVLRDNATFGGIDFEHGINHRRWILSGFVAGSRVEGSAKAIDLTQRSSTHYLQRPDASYLTYDPTRTSLSGHMEEVAVQKTGSVFGSVAYKQMSPTFELNDLGFIGRGDYRALSDFIGYQNYTAGKHLRSFTTYAYTNNTWNFGGQSIYRGVSGAFNATTTNLWSFNVGATRILGTYDDRMMRGGPIVGSPAGYSVNGSLSTDSRWPVIVSANVYYQRYTSQAEYPSYGLSFDMRPTSTIHISFGPSYSGSRKSSQYITALTDPNATATYGKRYVFANLDQNTLSLDTRIEWTLTRTLSLQTYIQPFVASGRYTAIKEFARPGTFAFAVYGRDQGTEQYDAGTRLYTIDPDAAGPSPAFQLPNPNFNLRSLHGNAVLRWEYRPGSTIFLVWQQERSGFVPTGQFDAAHDVGDIFRTVPTNVLLIKAAYWIGH
jgi:hypothetical protein